MHHVWGDKGLTAGRFRGTVGLRSEGTYDVVIEQFGQVELDRQSDSAFISTVIRLRKMIEAKGTVPHWIAM